MRNKMVIVTTSWDDGHKLDSKIVEMLECYNLKGTFYIPLRFNGMNKKLSKKDIKSISEIQEVGAHTVTHPSLIKISSQKAYDEILKSKEKLKKISKKKVECFAYPFGDFNERIKSIVKDCGFLCGRTVKELNIVRPSDPFEWNTTINAFDHHYAIPLIRLKLLSIRNILNWEHLAKSLFNLVYKKGGVYENIY